MLFIPNSLCQIVFRKRHSLGVAVEMTSDETGNASDSRIQLTLTSRILRWLPLQTRSDSSVVKGDFM